MGAEGTDVANACKANRVLEQQVSCAQLKRKHMDTRGNQHETHQTENELPHKILTSLIH